MTNVGASAGDFNPIRTRLKGRQRACRETKALMVGLGCSEDTTQPREAMHERERGGGDGMADGQRGH